MFSYQEMSPEQRSEFLKQTPNERIATKVSMGVQEPESRTNRTGYFHPDNVSRRRAAAQNAELTSAILRESGGMDPNAHPEYGFLAHVDAKSSGPTNTTRIVGPEMPFDARKAMTDTVMVFRGRQTVAVGAQPNA